MAPSLCTIRNRETGVEWEVERDFARSLLLPSPNYPVHDSFDSDYELVEGDLGGRDDDDAVERTDEEVEAQMPSEEPSYDEHGRQIEGPAGPELDGVANADRPKPEGEEDSAGSVEPESEEDGENPADSFLEDGEPSEAAGEPEASGDDEPAEAPAEPKSRRRK